MRKIVSFVLSILFLSGIIGAAQAQGDCPPSRLVPYQSGRVTPGSPNRMREEPSPSSRLVATIPGNKVFFVYETGTCAEGYLWARVAYNNQIGWTPEAKGDEYYVEPVPPPDGAIVVPAGIFDVAWSSNGKTIALATSAGVYLLDTANPTPTLLTQDRTDEVEFSPTAPNILATSAIYGMLRVWDLAEKKVLHEEIMGDPNGIALMGNAVGDLSFTSDGKLLFVVTVNDLVAYDTTTWQPARTVKDFMVVTAAMSPDGQQIAIDGASPTGQYLLDWSGQAKPLDTPVIADFVFRMTFSPDSKMLAMSDTKGHVVRVILATGQKFTYTAQFDTAYHTVDGLTFSPDSKLLVMGDYTPFRGVLRLMNAASMDEIGTVIPDGTIKASRFAFSPDGSKIASVFDDVLLIVNTGDIHP